MKKNQKIKASHKKLKVFSARPVVNSIYQIFNQGIVFKMIIILPVELFILFP